MDDVDRLIDDRGGAELLAPRYDHEAQRLHDVVHRSSGTTAAHMVVTGAGRVVVNTGMGFEAPHHKTLFDAVHPGPTPYILTTQAHVDHVGGVATFREAETRYVAQANNAACQADDARIAGLRRSAARIWFDLRARLGDLTAPPARQDTPTPDLTFDDGLTLTVGDEVLELVSTPGGETTDSCVVWLPRHRVALVSNLFGPLFPHFPNLCTLRGDRYRFVEPYLDAVRTVRALEPELLITGRGAPIEGGRLIEASLTRLHDAVDHVHRATLDGMNAGADLRTLMREITLPPELRVGEAYGTVAWGVRTIWESYTGWFRRVSTTELYPFDPLGAMKELAALAGVEATAERARTSDDPVLAIALAEAVLALDPSHVGALDVLRRAHETLLEGDGGNFWLAGWLRHQIITTDPGTP